MTDSEREIVYVRRQWSDWRIGTVPLDALWDFHWRSESGGVRISSPRPFNHARMFCTALIEGEIAHTCEHGPPPHEILVCFTKKDNGKKMFDRLKTLADSKATDSA